MKKKFILINNFFLKFLIINLLKLKHNEHFKKSKFYFNLKSNVNMINYLKKYIFKNFKYNIDNFF